MEALRLPEAEKRLGVSRSTLKRWILTGHIKTVKTQGGHHRIPSSEIARLSGIASTTVEDDSVSQPQNSERPHVLVVDDSMEMRSVIEHTLIQSGLYDVTTAANATEALERVRVRSVDAYVLDNVLPDISGIDLCRRIRKTDKTTPIIFFSFFKYQEQVDEALEAKAQAYVKKPYLDTLLNTLDSFVNQKQ